VRGAGRPPTAPPPGAAAGRRLRTVQPPHSVRLVVLTRSDRPARAPEAAILAPAQAAHGQAVALEARLAADSDPAVSYRWRFDDGLEFAGPRVSRAFTLQGERTARLTVTGVDGLQSVSTAKIAVVGELVTTFQPDRLRRPGQNGLSPLMVTR
jgi:hypothetical protein